MDGATGTHTKRKRESDEMTDETIKNIAFRLQLQGNEDMALELEVALARMKHELERIKGIASRRLDRIAVLQHQLAVVEDKLEDTRSDLKTLADNRLERIMNLLGALDATKDSKTIQRDNELAAEVDPEQARVELGREPRSHIDYE